MTISNTLSEYSKNTYNLLRCISTRLSGREDCKGVEYQVTIYDAKTVRIVPNILIFPDTYRRKSCDKITILQYAILHSLSPVSICIRSDSYILSKSCLIPGKYVFTLSADKRKRKWINVSEVNNETKISRHLEHA